MPAHCQPQEHKLQVTVFKGTVQHYFNHSFVPEIKALNKIYDNFAVPMVKLKKKIHIVLFKGDYCCFFREMAERSDSWHVQFLALLIFDSERSKRTLMHSSYSCS